MVKSKTWWAIGVLLGGCWLGAPALFGARVKIPAGTAVPLRLENTVTSESSLNEPVDFTVTEAVMIGDVVVIPAGAHATGGVSLSRAGGGKVHGHHGSLGVTLNGVYAVDRTTVIPLRFSNGRTYTVTSSSKKRAARMERGAGFTAYVDRDSSIEYEPPRPPEPIASLTADPTSVEKGRVVTLTWSSTNATEVVLEPGIGKVDPSGSRSVTPSESTTYTLTAKGAGGTKVATASVNVAAPPPPKQTGTVDFNSDPQGANVTVDGNLIGTTPSKIPLEAGPHKVVLTLRGYKTWEGSLTVYPGGSQSVAPSLEKEAVPPTP